MSMSKPITALAAMQLVEKGKLNLDSPVEEVLPEIKEIPVLNTDGKLVKQSKSITLRHLMSHTSGFAYNSLMMITSKKIKDLSISMKILLFLKGIITYIYPFSKGPRLFEAGTDFKYGTGLGWNYMTFDLYNNGAELMNSRVNTYEYPAELAKDFEIRDMVYSQPYWKWMALRKE